MFSGPNFFSIVFSKIFPNLSLSGKGLIKVQASDNLEILKELSDDPFFIHKPKLKSLNGITNLMDESFEDAKNLFHKSIEINNNDHVSKFELSKIFLSTKEYRKGLEFYEYRKKITIK